MNLVERPRSTVFQAQRAMAAMGPGSRPSPLRHAQSPDRQVERPAAAAEGDQPPLHSFPGMLDRLGYGCLVLSETKKVLKWNATARVILSGYGSQVNNADGLSGALRSLIANVPCHLNPGSFAWIVVRSSGDRPVVINERGLFAADNTIVVALLDRETKSAPNPQTLQRMFGLTGAETHLAVRLAKGYTPLEIAESCALSRTTIRTQLASLFAKTETRRQAELVTLLARVSVLP
ncbi:MULTISPECIES: helix-turn-helix transcriptional regulator [Mesorhizobium]|uniref:helix-turn-helix transcriptional regulator n=1 Tax=Mesorhizobium TaxID=68287 RepID=UPI0004CEB7C1|nr:MULTISPECIES: helix-turn-helix transcriptional regulator [unclassified Mesorhizobium]